MPETILYRVYYSPETKTLAWFEQYQLYSKPKEFFARLSKPFLAEKEHKKAQREFVRASNTFRIEAYNRVFYIQFMFDTSPEYRQAIIENMPNLKKVNFDD